MAQLQANPFVSSQIPAIIHQIWIQGEESFPEVYRRAARTWQKNNPDWHYTLWDDSTLRAFMARETPEWLPIYESYSEMQAKADVGRYALLLARGGLYADVDTECVRPISRMIGLSQATLFLQPYAAPKIVEHAPIANSVIACAPEHPIWRQVLAELERSMNVFYIPARTGPIRLWSAAKVYVEHNAKDVCFWDREILTKFYLPRACMRWYSSIQKEICILDFNDCLRQALLWALRRPDQYLTSAVKLQLSKFRKRSDS